MQQQHSLLMGDGAAVGARRVAATAVVPDLEPCASRAAARVGQGAARSCDRKRVPCAPPRVSACGRRRRVRPSAWRRGARPWRRRGTRPPGAPGGRSPAPRGPAGRRRRTGSRDRCGGWSPHRGGARGRGAGRRGSAGRRRPPGPVRAPPRAARHDPGRPGRATARTRHRVVRGSFARAARLDR